ncbi:MAG: thiolase family protein [Candidatus Omnitrophota bacterium]
MPRQPVYIIDAVRTPMGRACGKMKLFSVDGLACSVFKALIQRNPEVKSAVDGVVLGTAVSAGAGQNFVRKAMIDAGLPEKIPGYTTGCACASGLQAVINACQAILSGDAGLVIAASAESVSNMPELVFKRNHDIKKIRRLTESLMHDGLWCSISERWMGLLCEDMARKEKISRKDQDDYAFAGYQRAVEAQKKGFFADEIIPVTLAENKFLHEDETIRKNIKREIFDSFESAFELKGTITAGNSSAPCDGACGLVLAGENLVRENQLHPLARVVGYASIAGSARDVFYLAGHAVKEAVKKAGISLQNVGLFEASEAFAAQMIFIRKELGVSEHKFNIYGGDLVLGHPLGVAGGRVLVTLIHSLKRRKERYGVACVCYGGGGAIAAVLENVNNSF